MPMSSGGLLAMARALQSANLWPVKVTNRWNLVEIKLWKRRGNTRNRFAYDYNLPLCWRSGLC